MNRTNPFMSASIAAMMAIAAIGLSACNTAKSRDADCPMPQGYNLNDAFMQVRTVLTTQRRQCAPQFDSYIQRLLQIASENPASENKRRFSDFLLAVSDEGIISERQAQNLYNRYFNVKFVSLIGDYSICSEACPARSNVMADMTQELADKEVGLLAVSSDRQSFQRADRLLQETELVLEATCASCTAQR